MKRLIKSKVTGLYFGNDGTWTTDREQAQEFSNTPAAIAMHLHKQLGECELVLQIGAQPSAQYDVVLSLSPKSYGNAFGSSLQPGLSEDLGQKQQVQATRRKLHACCK
ncbi:MAG TPA: hypothetical protein VL361_06575 [Candidatus Limnocylindrales bacterium]|nr:hypothetical protein [Candidatus Limnocylindrales bacterium]